MAVKEGKSGRNKLAPPYYGPYRVVRRLGHADREGLTFEIDVPPAKNSGPIDRIFPAKHLREGQDPQRHGGRVYDPPGRGSRQGETGEAAAEEGGFPFPEMDD
jgi:hypothetical protein